MTDTRITATLYRRKDRPTWYMRSRLPGQSRYQRMSLRCRDKQVAQCKVTEFIRKHEREHAGIAPPSIQTDAIRRPILNHLADFISDLESLGRDEKYIYNLDKRFSKLAKAAGWNTLRDVTADSFVAWRSLQAKLAAKTLNEYYDAANVLMKWLIKQGRLANNPMMAVSKVSLAGKRTRKRRAFGKDEFSRLLDVAGSRRVLYLLAVATGLRRNELKTLLRSDVHLACERPYIALRAENAKNRRATAIALRADVACELAAYIGGVDGSDTDPVFVDGIPSMDQFRTDLQAAGLPYKDKLGRQLDFHSFRHTLATWLHAAGVPQRQAMEVMRHSDARLTNEIYADTTQLPALDALSRLPLFATGIQQASSNDGCNVGVTGGAIISVRSGPVLSSPVTDIANADVVYLSEIQGQNDDSDSQIQNCHRSEKSSPSVTVFITTLAPRVVVSAFPVTS